MTPIDDGKFDCVIQSCDVREYQALKQPEELRPSPMICPDGKRLLRTLSPRVSRSVFKMEAGLEKPRTHTSLKRLPSGAFLA